MTPTTMTHDLYSQFHQGLNQIRSGCLNFRFGTPRCR